MQHDLFGPYLRMWKLGFTFEGRTSRRDFWMAALWSSIIMLLLSLLGFVKVPLLIILAVFVACSILPSYAMMFRRLHDVGRSGWWLLLSILPFGELLLVYFEVQQGTEGNNRYGPDPRIRFEIPKQERTGLK